MIFHFNDSAFPTIRREAKAISPVEQSGQKVQEIKCNEQDRYNVDVRKVVNWDVSMSNVSRKAASTEVIEIKKPETI
ncbi:hypothetical protein IG518_19065 [Vibrio cholerae]|nr:hypothetical protein [Vibrio cholerae]